MQLTIEREIPITERYSMFLRFMSTLFNLSFSEREIKILNEFYQVDAGQITQDSRKQVAVNLNITEFNLNNYIKKLRIRNVIKETGISEKLLVNVMPGSQTFSIAFNLPAAKAVKVSTTK